MAKYAKFFSVGGGAGPNGLQLPLGTVLDATLRQVQDGTGTGSPLYLSTGSVRIGTTAASAMYWDNTNNRLGIGTNAPVSDITINSATGNPTITLQRNGVSRGSFYETSGGTNLQGAGNGLWLGANGRQDMVFTWDGNNYSQSTSFTFGTNSSLGARVGIKGSGSTSATTSFLVQNSAGNERLRVYDDGTIFMGNTNPGIYTTFGYSGRIGNNIFESPSAIYRYGGGQLTFYGVNNNANAFSFEHNNQQGSVSTGISMINLGGTYQNQQSFEFANLRIAPTYDFNANTTTNAIARGIYYNPTITNLRTAQHRAIETTTGDVLFGTTSGKATFGSGVAGTSYIEIKPGISNGNNRITFNDFDGGTSTRGGFIEISTYLAQINFGSYNPFYLGDSSKPYNFYKVAGLSNIIISTGNVIPTDSGALFQVKGTGSTSATTSLLVQNSSGNNTLQITDDAKVIVNGNNSSSGDNFRVNNSSGNYVMKTTNGYSAQFGYFGAGNSVSIMDGGVSSAFRAGLPLISPSWYAGYFTCATGDVRIGQDPTGTNSNASAILQCNTTTQGFLPPRVTTIQKNAISLPANGLMVYDTDLARPCFYNGATWTTL